MVVMGIDIGSLQKQKTGPIVLKKVSKVSRNP